MSALGIRKIAVGFALFSFSTLVFGSLLGGARVFTALIRGIEAGIAFGFLAWLMSSFLLEEEAEGLNEDAKNSNNEKKGQNLEHVA